jgi:hypothetical protein
MSKGLKIFWVTLIVVAFVGLGVWYLSTKSSTENTAPTTITTLPSSLKLINSFSFLGLNPEVDGAVDNTNYAINLLVLNGTDVTKLIPTISISDGATISPNAGVPQDFTNPVTYTVTAQDGSTQSYIVTVTTGALGQTGNTGTQSSDNTISSFVFSALSPQIAGVIDNNAHTVTLTVPIGTDVTNLVPTITVAPGATTYPYSDVAQDFTNSVIYTVTAQDGTIEDYTVTVTVTPAPVQTSTQ